MTSPAPHIAVVIPAFNEEESIRGVVTEVTEVMMHAGIHADVVVVNDGSTDGTIAAVRGLPCTLLNLPFNVGIGGAVQLGLRYAYARGCSVAVQVDGDGQHPPSDIAALVQPLLEDRADVVIGSRFLLEGGSRSTFGRRVGIWYFNRLQGLLIGRRITDSTSGFRAMNRKALAVCIEEYPDQYPEPETIVLFSRRSLRITEVPVHMSERRGGRSSIGTFASMLYMFKVTLAMLMTDLRTHH